MQKLKVGRTEQTEDKVWTIHQMEQIYTQYEKTIYHFTNMILVFNPAIPGVWKGNFSTRNTKRVLLLILHEWKMPSWAYLIRMQLPVNLIIKM